MPGHEESETIGIKNRHFADSLAALDALNAPLNQLSSSLERPSFFGYQIDEKFEEVERQISRIRPFLMWAAENEEADIDDKGLNQAISLLRQIAKTPSPVPMLSVSNDGKSSLYVKIDGRSIEATLDDNKLDYLLASEAGYQFFEDEIENGIIPSNLLYLLYSHFARNRGRSEK